MTIPHEILPGLTIKIDAEDLPKITSRRWRMCSGAIVERSKAQPNLARVIIGAGIDQRVRRKNGDPTDYTRGNIYTHKVDRKIKSKYLIRQERDTRQASSYAQRLLQRVSPGLAANASTEAEAVAIINEIDDMAWMRLLQKVAP